MVIRGGDYASSDKAGVLCGRRQFELDFHMYCHRLSLSRRAALTQADFSLSGISRGYHVNT